MGWFRRKASEADRAIIRELRVGLRDAQARIGDLRSELHDVRTEVRARFRESTLDAVKRLKGEREGTQVEDLTAEVLSSNARVDELVREVDDGNSRISQLEAENKRLRDGINSARVALGVDIKTEPPEDEPVPIVYGDTRGIYTEGVDTGPTYAGGEMIDDGEAVELRCRDGKEAAIPLDKSIRVSQVCGFDPSMLGEPTDTKSLDDCKINVGKFDGVDSVSLDIEMPFGYHSRGCEGAVKHHCFIDDDDEMVNTCGEPRDGCHGTNMWDDVDCPACLKMREEDDDATPDAEMPDLFPGWRNAKLGHKSARPNEGREVPAMGKVREVERIADSRPSTSDYPWAMLFTCAGCMSDKCIGDREPSVDEWLCTDCHASGVVVVDRKADA